MSGKHRGVQTEIRKIVPTALYVHCASHCLNLALTAATKVKGIKASFGIMSEIVNFLNGSAKRAECLKRVKQIYA